MDENVQKQPFNVFGNTNLLNILPFALFSAKVAFMIESFIFHCVVGIVPLLQLQKQAHVSENKLKFKEKEPQQYTLIKTEQQKKYRAL